MRMLKKTLTAGCLLLVISGCAPRREPSEPVATAPEFVTLSIVGTNDPLLVVVSDFLATGGDGILAPVMPPGGFPVDYAAPLMRDVFVEYLKNLEGPLREEQLVDTSNPQLAVTGALPMSCAGV